MNVYPWLQDDLVKWQKIIESKQVPHAILLSGIKGTGKFELAQQMAHYALCENLTTEGVCQKCSSCELVKVGNHTDLTIISAEKAIIKVDQIRKLSKSITLTTTKNQYKVIIIKNAEQMNASAANALLKTLEEPPQKVIIILTSSEISKLLPTIKSRCIKTHVRTPSYRQSIEWLRKTTTAHEDKINLSLVLVNNSPLTAKQILENETLEQIQKMINDLNQLLNQNKTVIEVSKAWFKNEWHKNLVFIASFYFNQLKIQHELQIAGYIEAMEAKLSSTQILSFIKKIHVFVHLLKTTVKAELLLEDLLIYWKNIKNK